MKKMLGILLIAGAVAGAYAARSQIKAAVLGLRDRALEAMLLGLDDPGEDEEEERQRRIAEAVGTAG